RCRMPDVRVRCDPHPSYVFGLPTRSVLSLPSRPWYYCTMTKLAANWSILLMSQLMKGKFFLRTDIALGMGTQVANLINRQGEVNAREKRRLEVTTISDSGKGKAFFYDDDDEDDEEEDRKASIYDSVPTGSVARIPVKGTMLKYGTMCEYGMQEIGAF